MGKSKWHLLCPVFFTVISLLTAMLASKEEFEKVYADDYSTYLVPSPANHSSSHIDPSVDPVAGLLTPLKLPSQKRSEVADLLTFSATAKKHNRFFILYRKLIL